MTGAFGSFSYVVSVLPGGWHPPQYWAIGGLAFFGGWLMSALLLLAASKAYEHAFPTRVRLEPHGGPRKATLVVFVESGTDAFHC
jgi:hypothetical protein